MKKKRITKEELGWVPYAELKAQQVLDHAEQRRRDARVAKLKESEETFEEALRFSRFKARKEGRLIKTSNKLLKGLTWDKAVCLLTSAVSEAIWHEGGARDDAIATAEIVHHAICRDLNARFDGRKNIVPFKRNPDYFRKKTARNG